MTFQEWMRSIRGTEKEQRIEELARQAEDERELDEQIMLDLRYYDE